MINRPGRAKLLQDRSTTLPIVVFFTMVLATIALRFILQKLRPRARDLTPEAQNAGGRALADRVTRLRVAVPETPRGPLVSLGVVTGAWRCWRWPS